MKRTKLKRDTDEGGRSPAIFAYTGQSSGRYPRKVMLAILACLALVLTACSAADTTETTDGTSATTSGGGTTGSTGATETTQAGTDEEITLVVAIPELGPLDFAIPTSRSDGEKMLAHVGDFLTELNPETGQIQGMLAEEITLSDDGLTWTFKLREGIQFHDGWGELTAEDVEFSWGQWVSEESTHGQRVVLRDAIGGDMANFVVNSTYEFSVTADDPVTSLLNSLCSCEPGMTIFPKAYYEQTDPEIANNHPIGTGPWKFVSGTVAEELVFDANEEYWRGAPTADHMILREVLDDSARLAQVQSGDVDLALLGSRLVGEAVAAGLNLTPIENILNVQLYFGGAWWGNPEHLDRDSPWIQEDEPEKGLAIREALSLAIDRDLILERVLFGLGERNHGPVIANPRNPALVDPSWDFPAYDLDLAKQKLAEGGHPDGFPLTFLIMGGEDIDTLAIGEAVAGMFEELGLQVERKPYEPDLHQEEADAFETDGYMLVAPVAITPEPAKIPATLLSGNDGSRHWTHPEIDAYYEQMSSALAYEDRLEAGRQFIGWLRDSKTAIALFNAHMPFVAGPRIASWEPYSGNFVNSLQTITFNE